MEVIQEQYKDTKTGKIPNDWEIDKIGSVADCFGGTTPSTTVEEYWNGDILWATPSDITKNDSEYLLDTDRKITEKGRASKNLRFVKKDGLLMTSRASIGFLNISNGDVTTNQGFINIECKDSYHYKFFYYWIINNRNQLIRFSQGSTFLELYRKTFSKINVPLPPLPEQQKIAEILSTVDEQISATECIIEKSKELKKGLMQKLFTEGIGHTEFKDTKVGRIPKDWEIVKIMDISENLDSKRVPIKSADRANMSGEYPYYGAQGIIDWVNQYIFDGDYLLVAEDGENVKSQKNDIAFLVGGKFWVNNHAHVLRCKGDYSQVFLSYYLNQLNIRKYVSGSAQPKLNKGTLMKIQVVAPSLSEQQKIADILSEADTKIKKEEQEKAQLEQLKKGLMQQLLTGQKRVKV